MFWLQWIESMKIHSDIEMSRPCVFDMNHKVDDLEIPKILIKQLQSGGSLMSMKKKKIVVACCRDGMKECWEMIRFRHGFHNWSLLSDLKLEPPIVRVSTTNSKTYWNI